MVLTWLDKDTAGAGAALAPPTPLTHPNKPPPHIISPLTLPDSGEYFARV
jgi:hypothetical protein